MAVQSVTENGMERSATSSINSNEIVAVRVFDVVMDGQDDVVIEPLLARDAEGIPQLYELLHEGYSFFVKNKPCRCKAPHLYEVTVNYGLADSTSGEVESADPLSLPAEISFLFSEINEKIDRDINGDAILNSAGMSFDPPITKEFHDLVLRIVHNEINYSAATALSYMGTVCSGTFNGGAAGTVKCTNYDATRKRQGGITYWEVVREFTFRLDGWKRRVLDEGFVKKIGVNPDGTPELEVIKDNSDNEEILTQPVPLNGSGEIAKADGSDIHFHQFEIYASRDFSVFNSLLV